MRPGRGTAARWSSDGSIRKVSRLRPENEKESTIPTTPKTISATTTQTTHQASAAQTLKMRRHVDEQHFGVEIERLYAHARIAELQPQ